MNIDKKEEFLKNEGKAIDALVTKMIKNLRANNKLLKIYANNTWERFKNDKVGREFSAYIHNIWNLPGYIDKFIDNVGWQTTHAEDTLDKLNKYKKVFYIKKIFNEEKEIWEEIPIKEEEMQ